MCAKRTATPHCRDVNIFPRIFLLAGRDGRPARTHARRERNAVITATTTSAATTTTTTTITSPSGKIHERVSEINTRNTRAIRMACRARGWFSGGGGSSLRLPSTSHARGGALAVTRLSFVGGGLEGVHPLFARVSSVVDRIYRAAPRTGGQAATPCGPREWTSGRARERTRVSVYTLRVRVGRQWWRHRTGAPIHATDGRCSATHTRRVHACHRCSRAPRSRPMHSTSDDHYAAAAAKTATKFASVGDKCADKHATFAATIVVNNNIII